nr:MAG TPA: hypothetical protein [Caudoviricetes sp.]
MLWILCTIFYTRSIILEQKLRGENPLVIVSDLYYFS